MKEKYVVTIGPFPPPIHGMAKNLQIFYDQVSCKSKVYKIDTSPGTIVRGLSYHFNKLLKVTFGVSKLFSLCLFGKVKNIYLPPDAGFGAWYSLLFVLIARTFEIELFLHHRSFLYINKKTKAMDLIVKIQPKTTHIFLCNNMRDKFCNLYNNKSVTLVASNAQYVTPIEDVRISTTGKLIIGHLSNLGFEKGIKEVFGLAEEILSRGLDIEIHIAGPFENKEVEDYFNRKMESFSRSVIYYGPVYDDLKVDFYNKIDCFIFPTTYRNEAQPNVLFEAMSFGVPVFSIDTGCISTDVNCSNGFVFGDPVTFVQESTEILERLCVSPKKLFELKRTTLESIKRSSIESKCNYNTLIDMVCR